jgi:eukaryotic-like serine/threonine-protein kinase
MVDAGAFGQLRPGSVLIGKYEIVRPIGRGGFGLVYEARHLGLGTGVAVKILNSEARQNPKTIARFRQEAWTAARIASENVVRVTDIDVLDDGTPFLVMELLVGRDLDRELKIRGRLPSREAVDYLLQAASGIREAHRQGIVHRDLKTSNLFLVDEPGGRRVKVLDFGLSKIVAALSMTATNTSLGTPHYESPEQLRSAKSADARSDIWSLGVITYQLLSGRLPFRGETAAELIVQIVGTEPAELGLVAPDVPAGLCLAVTRALQKKPEHRFESVDEFAAAMAPFGSPHLAAAISARRPEASGHAVQPGPSSTFLDSSQDTPPERRSSRVVTGVALLAVAVLVTLAAGLRFGGHLLAPSARERPAAAPALVTPEPRAATSPPAPVPAVDGPVPRATTRSEAAAPVPSATPSATTPARPSTRAPKRSAPPRKSGVSKDLGF